MSEKIHTRSIANVRDGRTTTKHCTFTCPLWMEPPFFHFFFLLSFSFHQSLFPPPPLTTQHKNCFHSLSPLSLCVSAKKRGISTTVNVAVHLLLPIFIEKSSLQPFNHVVLIFFTSFHFIDDIRNKTLTYHHSPSR